MKMRFILKAKDLVVEICNKDGEVVGQQEVDVFIDDRTEDVTEDQVLEIFEQLVLSKTFLTERMTGLNRVGESSLTIEPLEE